MCDNPNYLLSDSSSSNYLAGDLDVLSTMTEPVSAIASSIGTTFKLADFCLRLQGAPDDVRIFGQLIDRVRKDLRLLKAERHAKSALLASHDVSARTHIDETVSDTENALVTIGRLVEGGRVDGDKGRNMTLAHRFAWVLKNKDTFITHQSLLATCHQSLGHALNYLLALSAEGGTSPLPLPSPSPPTYEIASAVGGSGNQWGEFVRSPSARRPPKKNDKEEEKDSSSSLPSPPATGKPALSSMRSFSSEADANEVVTYQPLSPTASLQNDNSTTGFAPDPVPWDTGTRAETVEAAATAIRSLGGESAGIAAIADSLNRGGGSVKERRRMRQVMFAGKE